MHNFLKRLNKPSLTAFIALFLLALTATAGSLTPSAAPGSTMNTLGEIYDSIASDSFDSSAILADADGSLIQHLKFIEENLFSLSSDSLDFDEFVDSMTLDANLSVASGSFNTTWNGDFYHMQGNVGIGTTGPLAGLHIVGGITSPGGGTNSEEFGLNASAAGNGALAIGNNARATLSPGNNLSTVVGRNALATGQNQVVVGSSAQADGINSVAIGASADAVDSSTIALGVNSSAGGNNSIAIGTSAKTSFGGNGLQVALGATSSVSGQLGTALGYGTRVHHTSGLAVGHQAQTGGNQSTAIGAQAKTTGGATSIALGYRAKTTAANQMVIGSTSFGITDVYIGEGVQDITPLAVTLNATGGLGTDIAGANLQLAGGRGTGTGAGGSINFQTAPAGTSGSSLNTLSTRMAITASGHVGIGTTTPAMDLHIASSGEGNILRLQDSDGTCDLDPDSGGLTTSCSSDISLKSNIQDASSSLNFLSSFHIREYTVNASGDRTIGVIAQEVQEIHPELVAENSDGILMVRQPSIWHLVKSIQELEDRIASQQGTLLLTGESPDADSLFDRIVALFKDLLGIEFGEGRIKTDTVESERLCVGGVCVTEQEFMEVFGTGVQSTETPEPTPSGSGGGGTDSSPTPTPEPTESPDPSASPSPSASPDPSVTPDPSSSPDPTESPEPTPESNESIEPSPEPTPEPEPEPEPEPSPESEPTPEPEE